MGRGRHDTFGVPVDYPVGTREPACKLAGADDFASTESTAGGSADREAGVGETAGAASPSLGKTTPAETGDASTCSANLDHPAQAMMPLCAFDTEGAHVTVWSANYLGCGGMRNGGDMRNNRSDVEVSRILHDDRNTKCNLNHIVYLHVYDGDGLDVLKKCQSIDCPPFTLVAIKPASWNDDLTPWECPGLFADDAPFAGHAQDQLRLLEEEIIPRVEWECSFDERRADPQDSAEPNADSRKPRTGETSAFQVNANSEAYAIDADRSKPNAPRVCRTIAGYSLAGLFATWAAFNSSAFSRIASASGSLWYPSLPRFVAEQALARPVDCAYFSLGSKEAKTPSRLLRNVATGTDEVVAAFRSKGVQTRFDTNPGNHFKEPALRMAQGIAWAVSQQAANR